MKGECFMKYYGDKLTESDINEILDAAANDLRLEGMEPTEFDYDITRQLLRGDITMDRAIDIVLRKAGVEK